MKYTIILANGDPPSKKLFKKYIASADLFICADGGANTAARFKVAPHIIIGDLDSIHKKTLRLFKYSKIKKVKDQNSTDLEKALTEAIKKKSSDIIVLGATGGRLDHAIGNLSALIKYSRYAAIKIVDDTGIFIPVKKALKLSVPVGTTISLLPLSRCSGIITSGLKWNLNNEFLELGMRESTSNIVTSSPAIIKVRKGNLIIFVINNDK